MGVISWEERGRRAQAGLLPVRFLEGSWVGEGETRGEAVTARLEVRRCLSETYLEARETLTTGGGDLEHEDVCFYRYDPDNMVIKVTQHTAFAWTTESLVQPEAWGARWYSGPFSPRVEWRLEAVDRLVEMVFDPEEADPSLVIRYRRL